MFKGASATKRAFCACWDATRLRGTKCDVNSLEVITGVAGNRAIRGLATIASDDRLSRELLV